MILYYAQLDCTSIGTWVNPCYNEPNPITLSFIFALGVGRQGWHGGWPKPGWLLHKFKDLINSLFTPGENFQNWVRWEGRHLRQTKSGDGKDVIFDKQSQACFMFLEFVHLSF
jgi:hypothetical protein